MDCVELSRRLPLGESSFPGLRRLSKIYVDKTDLIYALAADVQKVFLARPRRFGKSLLVSTFESLFRYGLRDFKGLAIEKKWRDAGRYSVVHLDFSNVKKFADIQEFRGKLNAYVRFAFANAGFEFPREWETTALNFMSWVSQREPQSVVLLIDEYDAPLTAKLNEPELFNAVRDELFEFYSVLKSQAGFFRFVFMTGITKFSQTGIFSELNDFSDISLSRTYAALLGYTQSEIESCFGEHIASVAAKLGISSGQVLAKLAENYDGYCFDGLSGEAHDPVRVYTPWSVLKFLSSPEDGFKNYWMTSGGKAQILTQYFKDHALKSPEEYGQDKLIPYADLDGSSDLDTINDVALLTQAGYLTIKSRASRTSLLVGYPNREVSESMAALYTNMLLRQKTVDEAGAVGFSTGLQRGDVSCVMQEINKVFLAINYERYPVRSESAVQACLQVFAAGAGFRTMVEKHNALGRSDLEIEAGDFRWVVELKFLPASEAEAEAQRLLEMAAEQMMSRRYGEEGGGKLVRVAAVFSEAQRQFTHWRAVGR